MNVPQINNLKLFDLQNANVSSNNKGITKYFNLRMSEPLKMDTVSFKAAAASNKAMGEIADMIRTKDAKAIIDAYVKPHNDMLKLIKKNFGEILSTEKNKGLITLKNRIKKNFSIRQKTTSIEVKTQEELLKEMKDISGFAFILEDGQAFQKFAIILNKMIKNKDVNVVDLEYYRLPPLYRRGKFVEDYNSLNTNIVSSIGKAVDSVNHTTAILDEKPSPAGYSGLHITTQTKDGKYSEWQVMTRAMWNLKEVENFFYKVKVGKALDPKYSYIEDALSALKPLPKYATEKEKAAQKTIKNKILQYTMDAYKERLKKPFIDRKEFLTPSDPELAKYDFNKIAALKELCENL